MATVYLTFARHGTILNQLVNNSDPLDATFAALGDPTRRAILARLTLGQWTVGELAEPFDMSLPAVSKHLRVLEEAGLLVRQRDGRIHRISLDPRPIEQAADWITEMRLFWESQFDALAAYLERTTEETCPPPPHPKRRRSRSAEHSQHQGKKSSRRGPTRRR
ncbi:MAG TPA: metalloregulator ArsR/SmtB family transcription factor [Thermoanaerobaculia bacterium]|jgi:DNA-binding transcriptional ArsR family regulator